MITLDSIELKPFKARRLTPLNVERFAKAFACNTPHLMSWWQRLENHIECRGCSCHCGGSDFTITKREEQMFLL
jgi:Zn ribbon nucleic-acid-binding protein